MYSVQQVRPGRKPNRRCSRFAIFITLVLLLYSSFIYYWFMYRTSSKEQFASAQDFAGNSQLALQSQISGFPSSQPSAGRNESKTSIAPPPLPNVDTIAKEQSAVGAALEQVPALEPGSAHKATPHSVAPLRSEDHGAAAPVVSVQHEPAAEEVQQHLLASGLHVFYYGWYGTPERDGKWLHWDHQVLPHWTKEVNARHPEIGKKHQPPGDIGSNYYPLLGPYSSSDPEVVKAHLDQISAAGIGVLVYSWWGRGTGDANGAATDENIIAKVMRECARTGVKIAFHLEPYEGRTAKSVKADAEFLMSKYGQEKALYRLPAKYGGKTVFYVYDSYHIPPQEWEKVLKHKGTRESVRGQAGDAVFLGLWVEEQHGKDLFNAGFDGFYTYFASKGFTYGSTYRNWEKMQSFAKSHSMMFVPSIGPGYIDTAIRPWNTQNMRDRKGGRYFEEAWSSADALNPEILSLTSFNEWHEGTQFEPIKKWPGSMDYGEQEGTAYLDMVRRRVEQCSMRDSRRNWCGPDGKA